MIVNWDGSLGTHINNGRKSTAKVAPGYGVDANTAGNSRRSIGTEVFPGNDQDSSRVVGPLMYVF